MFNNNYIVEDILSLSENSFTMSASKEIFQIANSSSYIKKRVRQLNELQTTLSVLISNTDYSFWNDALINAAPVPSQEIFL